MDNHTITQPLQKLSVGNLRNAFSRVTKTLGPGLITGAADDDPSGIATYSSVGAQFGFGMLWTMPLIYPFMAAIQEVCARIGRITGKGIAANLLQCYPRWLVSILVALLLFANTINLGADIGAMGAAVQLLVGGSAAIYSIALCFLSLLLQVFMPYKKYASVLKWTTFSLFAYVATAFAVEIDWGQALPATFIPRLSLDNGYLAGLVAVLGTTISLIFSFGRVLKK